MTRSIVQSSMRLPAVAFLLCTAGAASSQTPKTLADMRDHSRPLLVFEGGNAKQAEQQLAELAPHADGMRDRQMLIVGPQGTDKRLPTVMLAASEWRAAQQRFNVRPDEFTVILLGKDGGEKLRSDRPLTWEQLRQTVDGMPMRKEEMKHR